MPQLFLANHNPISGYSGNYGNYFSFSRSRHVHKDTKRYKWDNIEVERQLSVWPNPTTNEFQIQYTGPLPAEMKIWSATGSLLVEQNLLPNQTFKTNQWPSGIYLLEVVNETGAFHGKVVKR